GAPDAGVTAGDHGLSARQPARTAVGPLPGVGPDVHRARESPVRRPLLAAARRRVPGGGILRAELVVARVLGHVSSSPVLSSCRRPGTCSPRERSQAPPVALTNVPTRGGKRADSREQTCALARANVATRGLRGRAAPGAAGRP